MGGIAVLGPVRVIGDDGGLVPLGSRRQCVLLAVLVSRLGRVVGADALAEALWGDAQPEHPAAALQSLVFRLRRQLAPAGIRLERDGPGYRLAAGRADVDATRFEDLVAAARDPATAPTPDTAVRMLDEALALWRGAAYLEVADNEAVLPEATRVEELLADAAEMRAAMLLVLGRADEAARSMERLMQQQPFREQPVALRMRALARQGRHAEALAVYERFRLTLSDEVGIDPSPDLHSLEGEILRHDQPPTPQIGLPGNALVGREVDLAAITSRLDAGRLVTLTGPGGVGKTRLALHAAARVSPRYADGVWLCELAHVDAAEAVAAAVCSALQVARDTGHGDAQRIVQFLRTRRALLVLDNCEHVVDGVQGLVAAVLAGAPDVDVLATSRRRLGIDGEQLVSVGPLAVPDWDDPESPAVVLFVERARAVRPGFALTDDNTAAVCALCRRVDGLPLGVELAAARNVARTPAEILAEVTERLDRLGDPRRSRERHRSIDAVVAWSYERLEPVEQQVFCSLAVFSGGFTAEAVASVTGAGHHDAVDALTSLVEHSLVTARDSGPGTRFSMLEPIRQYAEARLGDEGRRARARHAAWSAAWVEAADAGLRSPDEARWAGAVAAELANLRAAHRWALEREPTTAARLAGALYWYAYWFGAVEAFEWAAAASEALPTAGAGPAVAAACATATLGACRRGDMATARALAGRGIAADPSGARFVWEALSSAEAMTGNYEQALDCQQRALDLARVAGDLAQQARELAARALVLGYAGGPDAAQAELAAATELAAVAGCPTVLAFCEYVGGEIRIDTDPVEARALFERARRTARTVGNRYLAAIAGVSAVSCAARAGDPTDALGGFAELLDYFDRTGSPAQQWTTIRSLIETLALLERDGAAAVLYGALAASANALPLIGADAARIDGVVTTLEARLGRRRFDRLAAEGAALGDEAAIAYARRCSTEDGAATGGATSVGGAATGVDT